VADVRSFMARRCTTRSSAQRAHLRAPSHGKPVLLYDLKCVGSQAYVRLASEIIQRERDLRAA